MDQQQKQQFYNQKIRTPIPYGYLNISSPMMNVLSAPNLGTLSSGQNCLPQHYMQVVQGSQIGNRLIQPVPTMYTVATTPTDLGNTFVASNVSSTLKHPGFLREPFFGCYQSNISLPLQAITNTSSDFNRGSGPSPYKNITIEELRPHFNKPIIMVAKDFNICITLMKKICRKAGIKRWPHRRIRSLVNTITQQQILLARSSPVAQQVISDKIDNLKEQLSMIIKDPDIRLDSNGKIATGQLNRRHSWCSSDCEDAPPIERTTNVINDARKTKTVDARSNHQNSNSSSSRSSSSSNNNNSVASVNTIIELAPLKNLPLTTANTSASREKLLKQNPKVYEEISKKIRQTMPSMAGALHILHFSRKLSAENIAKTTTENIANGKASLADRIRKNMRHKKGRSSGSRKPMQSIAALLNN